MSADNALEATDGAARSALSAHWLETARNAAFDRTAPRGEESP
jgi:hypothetical protein